MKEDTNEGLHQSILEEMYRPWRALRGSTGALPCRNSIGRRSCCLPPAGCWRAASAGICPRWLWSWAGESVGAGRCPFVLGTPRDIAGRIAQEVLEEAVIRPEIAVRVENLEILLDLCVRG